MSRFNIIPKFNRLDEDDDEETLFEKKALINDDDYDADTSEAHDLSPSKTESSTKIRKRQSASKSKLISLNGNNNNNSEFLEYNESGNLELSNLSGGNDANNSSENHIDYTYYTIQPSDTLQNICLRYACPLALVKRINGLMTDQDFYGLTKIKLPLGKLGLLQEVLSLQDQQFRNSCDQNELSSMNADRNLQQRPRFVNSPGTALSISSSTTRLNDASPINGTSTRHTNPTSDEFARPSSAIDTNQPSNSKEIIDHHAYSFPSLSDLTNGDVNINMIKDTTGLNESSVTRHIKDQSFIIPEIKHEGLIDADDIQAACSDNVQRVFQHLDFHVGKAKEAAENYDKRAIDLVQEINTTNGQAQFIEFSQTKVSKIPQLFRCNENFGLSQTKLIAFIIIVCLMLPLVYIFCRTRDEFENITTTL